MKRLSWSFVRRKLDRYRGVARAVLLAPFVYKLGPVAYLKRYRDLRRRFGFKLRELLVRGYIDPRLTDEELAQAVTSKKLFPLQCRIDPGSLRLMFDKVDFYATCERTGIPVPKLIAVYTRERRAAPGPQVATTYAGWDELWAESSFDEAIIKPVYGAQGVNIMRVKHQSGQYRIGNDRTYSGAQLLRHLSRKGYDHWLAQELLTGHPDLVGLSGTTAIQSIRMVTYVDDETPAVAMVAWLKVIGGGSIVDNFLAGATGNLVAGIDMETGRLLGGVGVGKSGLGYLPVSRHPATGVELEGFQLPYWDECKRLAVTAAEEFLPLRAVGWDIAMTDRGPVFLEGNARWGTFPGNPALQDTYRFLCERAEQLGV